VLDQSTTDYEVIIIDDGSTDGTALLVWNMREQFVEQGIKLHIISQPNQGVSIARNRGVAEAKGEYIAFLDADDTWHKHKLESHIDLHESKPEVGLSFARVNYCTSKNKLRSKPSKPQNKPLEMTDLLGQNPTISPSNWVLQRSLFNEIEGFKPEMTHAEDQEFLIRILAESDYQIDFINTVLVDYHTSIDGLSADIESMYQGWKTIAKCIEKYDSEFVSRHYKKYHAQYCFYLSRRNAQVDGEARVGWKYFFKALQSDIKTVLKPRLTISVAIRSIINSFNAHQSESILTDVGSHSNSNEGVRHV